MTEHKTHLSPIKAPSVLTIKALRGRGHQLTVSNPALSVLYPGDLHFCFICQVLGPIPWLL
jgi:hypothetical protein